MLFFFFRLSDPCLFSGRHLEESGREKIVEEDVRTDGHEELLYCI